MPIGDKRNEKRPPTEAGLLLIPGVNWSVLETLIAAPPPGIAKSRTIFRYHFGAFDVVMGNMFAHGTGDTVGHVVVEQLPVMVARVSRPYTGASLADEIDVRRDTVLRATARSAGFCGLATCFGASTTTSGSEVVAPPEGVAVCAIAVPLRPHSGATARLATKKSDENFTAIPPMF